MGAGLDEIDRRRSAFKRRLRQLDNLSTGDVKKLSAALVECVNINRELAWNGVLADVVNCFSKLVQRTPIDTGRARAGWMLTTQLSEEVPPPGEYPEYKANVAAAVQGTLSNVNLDEASVVYIISNIEYILFLEAGWSKHQLGGFIALFISELTQRINETARHFSQ